MADLRTYQPAFTAGELSPALSARTDLAKYASGLKTAINLFIHPHGGASNRPGTSFINEVKASANVTRLIPFQFNTEQSYVLEFGDHYFRVYRDGGLVLAVGVPYEVVAPYSSTEVNGLVVIQEADVMYVCHENHPLQKIARLADNNWTITPVSFAPKMTAPTITGVSYFGSPTPNTDYRYVVSAISAATGEESLPSAIGAVTGDLNYANSTVVITWAAVAGADRYIVYKQSGGTFGYIGGTDSLSFSDKNFTADQNDTPQKVRNPFNGAGNYPRCGAMVEQRLALGSTKNDPQAIWMSQSGVYENFGVSQPAKASDAVTFRIKARQVNEVRALLTLKGLMVLTSGSESIVSGGSNSDAITPSSIKIDNQGYRGCARVQPIVVGNTVLFAQRSGGVVRDFSFDYTQDGFTGRDLTILARHLFENKNIKAWAYAQSPFSIAWVVLDDGSLVSLTYLREHEVWAWTRHASGADGEAFFEDVVTVGEGNEDVPYFIVRRTIGGVAKRYIERLHTRVFATIADAFFVDCGLSYSGAPTKIITGLDHLNGQAVVALADGNVIRNLTVGPVTGGVGVVLSNAASKVHVGLPMVASLETLGLDLGQVQGLGTVQGRQKSINEVTLRVQDTRGIFVGPKDGERDSDYLVEYKQRATEAWNEAIALYTGDIRITPHWSWSTGGNMWIKQFDPLPMTILAFMPDVTVGK
ncbi:phage tail protein [Bradyrhizobium sp. 5.13L]